MKQRPVSVFLTARYDGKLLLQRRLVFTGKEATQLLHAIRVLKRIEATP